MISHALSVLIPACFWIVGNVTRSVKLGNHSRSIVLVGKNAPMSLDVDYVHKLVIAISVFLDFLDPQIVSSKTIYQFTSLSSLSSLLQLLLLAFQSSSVSNMDSEGLAVYAISCLQRLNSSAWYS